MQTNTRIQLEIRSTIQALLSLGSDENSRKLALNHVAKYFKTPEENEIVTVDTSDERMVLSTLLRWTITELPEGRKSKSLTVLTTLKLNPIVVSRQISDIEIETFKSF